MKKILLICVTYHSDKELHAFVESIRRAGVRLVCGDSVVVRGVGDE